MMKTPAKFKKIGIKLYEELHSQDTQGKCWRTNRRTNGRKLARLSRHAKAGAIKSDKN